MLKRLVEIKKTIDELNAEKKAIIDKLIEEGQEKLSDENNTLTIYDRNTIKLKKGINTEVIKIKYPQFIVTKEEVDVNKLHEVTDEFTEVNTTKVSKLTENKKK